ncbi:MAG TPA: MetQ/NlpA family ABC transporter substrate-binding protein [Coxiellaceae bacterium]|nr:MetQ/NlpA family ABC transporter substrate-binding protein [Coxiellaceae bacterium]
MKKILISLLVFTLTACSSSEPSNVIKVGVIAGPEAQLMEVAKVEAKKCYGLNVKIIQFSDYNTPNIALNDGSLDANMFQHQPYLDAQIEARHYSLVSIGKVFVYPMGLYSSKIHSLAELQSGDKIAIPNDPSNEARALLLLQEAQLIQLKPGADSNATPLDIASNPKNLTIIALDAAQLPRALNDVSLAVINSNFAIPAGLSPTQDALFMEGADSPYANIIVVRTKDENKPALQDLVKALHSQAVVDKAHELFGEDAIPAWH